MRTTRLVVDGFRGKVLLFESSFGEMTHTRARSMDIPEGWQSSRS